ncbi:hypothetical protein [Roseateles toxinivorans]|uniref:Uncharacterized protein n=1 Tax=Roseateles toxinivorans TaxID=270368 RepID=A0A4R6QTN7_9BURK|nr:hypothetical protein [Roseateles toxinivorans]TDP74741.1 hypothetical protein DES47_101807 [Roseateles toxinivorans]
MKQAKLHCPACGKQNGVSILYGFPSPEAMSMAERGEIALGGCCIPWEPMENRCLACEHEWGKADIGEDD